MSLADIVEDAGYPGQANELRNGVPADDLLETALSLHRIVRRRDGSSPYRVLIEILESWQAGEAVA
jgi:hypothetical protein